MADRIRVPVFLALLAALAFVALNWWGHETGRYTPDTPPTQLDTQIGESFEEQRDRLVEDELNCYVHDVFGPADLTYADCWSSVATATTGSG